METQFTFEGQRSDENVIFVHKRHPWVLSKVAFLGIGLVVILIFAYLTFGASIYTSVLLVLIIIFALALTAYNWFIYNNFLYILTNERLIIIEQRSLFSRRLNESELDKIQNIAVEVKGFMKTLLNFGNIKITTAGVDPVMILANVENPYEVQQKIAKYCKKINQSNTPEKQPPVLR